MTNPSQAEIRDAASKVAKRHLAPGAASRDQDASFPRRELAELGRHGLLGMLVPETWGGAGASHAALMAAIEEIAAVDGPCSMIMASQNTLANMILLQFGSEAQKRDQLGPLARGEKLCAFALSEPETGSDAFRLKTQATLAGDHYVLSGTKQFVTAGKDADYAIVFARTSAAKSDSTAFSAFLVPTASPGYQASPPEDTLGMRSSGTRQVRLEQVRVPAGFRIGEEGNGYAIATAHLGRSRLAIAAQALGIARAAFEVAARYSTERSAFGKPLAGHQAVAFRIADMATRLHAARLLIEDAASKLDAGKSALNECSMTKVFASEAAEEITRDAIQVLGGYGYVRDFGVERMYRDARVCSIYEGTSDLMRVLISNAVIAELRERDGSRE